MHVALRLALGLPLLAGCGAEPDAEPLTFVRTVRDLLADPPAFEVVEAHPDAPHALAVLTPSRNYKLDGADMFSLVLPPPAEVRFTVDDTTASRRLRMRAGVDVSAAKYLRAMSDRGAYAFEVLVNGASVFSSETHVARALVEGEVGTEWIEVGGRDGLLVQAGDIVTLRTRAVGENGASITAPRGPLIGFGGLRFEQRMRRARARSSRDEPNLVLIVVDTLRRDRLSTYGYERATSPHLDALAARGTVFEHAYSTASWTWPATASLLTGLQVREHGVTGSSSSLLASELTTLAEVCQDAGMSTAGWSGNPLISARRNFDQGFERLVAAPDGFRKTGEFFHEVETWLADQTDGRFFLYLHIVEPHHPYAPLPLAVQRFARDVDDTGQRLSRDVYTLVQRNDDLGGDALAVDEIVGVDDQRAVGDLYDACVWSADHWLGQVVDALERLGLTDRTVLAFTSDHGEELFERGRLGHGRTLHDELVRVPLVVAGPGVPSEQRRVAAVSTRSIAPYFAGRAGSRQLPGHAALFDERGASAVLYSTSDGAWGAERHVELLGLRQGARVVHYALSDSGETEFDPARLRMFDVAGDANERVDLARREQAAARAAWDELRERFEALVLARHQRGDVAGAATIELLERIGYAGR